MKPSEILKQPIVTEKVNKQTEKFNRYCFVVDKRANKLEIKKAVEKLEDYDQFSTLEQLKGSIWSIVGSAIFGLILAAIFKKDKPVF